MWDDVEKITEPRTSAPDARGTTGDSTPNESELQPGSGLQRLQITPEIFQRMIQGFMRSAGFTQEDMARYIGGVSQSTVNRWLKGKHLPRSKVIINRLMNANVLRDEYRR